MISVKCKDIIKVIEQEAPLYLQEDYDNSGLQWGNPETETEKILVCLDFSPEALQKAVVHNARLIISHHPILFKPLKKVHTGFGTGAMLADCIRNDICVYAAHTNFDTAKKGLNDVLARTLALERIDGLKTYHREKRYKLVVYVPEDSIIKVRDAIFKTGAGWIGNYRDCGFSVKGEGTFKPLEGTQPYIGKPGKPETVTEYRLETIVPECRLDTAVEKMLQAHPYEEVAYDIYRLDRTGYEYSLGRAGQLRNSLQPEEFIRYVKDKLNVPYVRTVGSLEPRDIRKIAVFCGSFDGDVEPLLHKRVDALVTGDLKYHDAQRIEQSGIFAIDAGHFHTEKLFVQAISEILKKALRGVTIIEHSGRDVFTHK